jgi:glutathione reductase (NADPH)
MVVNRNNDRIPEINMVGSGASGIFQVTEVMIKAGAIKKDFDSTIGIYPDAVEEFVTMWKLVLPSLH